MTRLILLAAISCFLLAGCYTQFETVQRSGVEHHYSQRCYYEQIRVATAYGVVKRYRRVCPSDFHYSERRWRSSFYYRQNYRRYSSYNRDYTRPDRTRTERPRRGTVGRGSSEETDRNRTERRDRKKVRKDRPERKRDRGGGDR